MTKAAPEIDFFPWIIQGKHGWEGVRDDAPEEVKKAYAEFTKKVYVNGFLVK